MPSILLPAETQRSAQPPLRVAKASATPFVIEHQETARQAQVQRAQIQRSQDRQEAQRQETKRQNDLRQNDRAPLRQPSSVTQAAADRIADTQRNERARPAAPRDVPPNLVRARPDALHKHPAPDAAGPGDKSDINKASASDQADAATRQDEASATTASDASSESAATDKQAIESGKQEREAETAKADARDEAVATAALQEVAPKADEEQSAANAPEAQTGLALAPEPALAQQLATAQQQVALADVAAGPQSSAGQAIKGVGTDAGAKPDAAIPDAGTPGTTANAATPGTPAAGADGTLAADAGNLVSARKGEGRHVAEAAGEKPVPAAQLKELVAAFEQPQAFAPANLSPTGNPLRETTVTPGSQTARHGGHQADADLRPTPLGALPIEIGMKALAGTKRFDIRLDPPELGRVDVRIEFGKDGEVSAHLIVDRVETLQLLQRDSRNLERAFDQAGLRTGDSGVQIALSDRNANGQNSSQSGDDPSSRSSRHRNGHAIADTELSRALDTAPTRRMRLGGVDVSI
jgi:flagellar hook-length control protein FliK